MVLLPPAIPRCWTHLGSPCRTHLVAGFCHLGGYDKGKGLVWKNQSWVSSRATANLLENALQFKTASCSPGLAKLDRVEVDFGCRHPLLAQCPTFPTSTPAVPNRPCRREKANKGGVVSGSSFSFQRTLEATRKNRFGWAGWTGVRGGSGLTSSPSVQMCVCATGPWYLLRQCP